MFYQRGLLKLGTMDYVMPHIKTTLASYRKFMMWAYKRRIKKRKRINKNVRILVVLTVNKVIS